MKEKLTLNIDKKVLAEAKIVASKKGKNISKLVEEYLSELTLQDAHSFPPEDSIVYELSGSISNPKKDYKSELVDILEEKYG